MWKHIFGQIFMYVLNEYLLNKQSAFKAHNLPNTLCPSQL